MNDSCFDEESNSVNQEDLQQSKSKQIKNALLSDYAFYF